MRSHLAAPAVPVAKGTVQARAKDALGRGPTAAAATVAGCPEEDMDNGLIQLNTGFEESLDSDSW